MGETEFRALTVRQPWAWALVNGHKDIENREWQTEYRGWLLLHASGRPASTAERKSARAAYGAEIPNDTVKGAIIGAIKLEGIHSISRCGGNCSKWSLPMRHHWEINGAITLPEPVPCKGKLLVWQPEPELLEKVLRQIGSKLI